MSFTSNPVCDAQSHIHHQDSKPYEYDHTCAFCKEGFDKGQGGVRLKNEDEHFCKECIDNYKHFDFYKICGAQTWQIMDMDKFRIKI